MIGNSRMRRVWLVAAVATMWLVATAAPAAAQDPGQLVGVAFGWGKWIVIVLAAFGMLKMWGKAAKDGTDPPLKKLGMIALGAVVVFYFFTQGGATLLREASETGGGSVSATTVAGGEAISITDD